MYIDRLPNPNPNVKQKETDAFFPFEYPNSAEKGEQEEGGSDGKKPEEGKQAWPLPGQQNEYAGGGRPYFKKYTFVAPWPAHVEYFNVDGN